MSRQKSMSSRKVRQETNVEWVLTSRNPTPLAFFRLTHPVHRTRAIEKYTKIFDMALNRCPDNGKLQRFEIDEETIQRDWEIWLSEKKAIQVNRSVCDTNVNIHKRFNATVEHQCDTTSSGVKRQRLDNYNGEELYDDEEETSLFVGRSAEAHTQTAPPSTPPPSAPTPQSTPNKRRFTPGELEVCYDNMAVICAFKNSVHHLPALLGKEKAEALIDDIKAEVLKVPSVWPGTKKYLDAVLKAPMEDFEGALRKISGKFQLYCKKVLTDFYHLVDVFPTISMDMGERKYIVQHISPLFKFYERTFGVLYFDWIESHSRAAKLAQAPAESGIVLLDANGTRVQDNHEVWHLEVAGSPDIFSTKHAKDDACKSMDVEVVTLISVLREYLSAPVHLAKQLKVFSCQLIGERITLYSLNLMEDGKFLAREVESAKIPFCFAARMRYIGLFKMMARFHDELVEQEQIIGSLEAGVYCDADESTKVRDVLRLPDRAQMLPYK